MAGKLYRHSYYIPSSRQYVNTPQRFRPSRLTPDCKRGRQMEFVLPAPVYAAPARTAISGRSLHRGWAHGSIQPQPPTATAAMNKTAVNHQSGKARAASVITAAVRRARRFMLRALMRSFSVSLPSMIFSSPVSGLRVPRAAIAIQVFSRA